VRPGLRSAVARDLLGDAVLKLIITKGVDIASVTSLTRGPTQAMHYAKLWTSPTCVVEGCSRTIVEYDHEWGAEYKDTRHTRLDEIERKCHTHHDLHTLHGWALVPGKGERPMVPPDDPRHPRPRSAPSTHLGRPTAPRGASAVLCRRGLIRRSRTLVDIATHRHGSSPA